MSVIDAGEELDNSYLAAGQILAALEGLKFHEESLKRRQELRTQQRNGQA
jgi:hypothetical protein